MQAPEVDDVTAGIYGEAETHDETSARANYVFFIMLFWALVGFVRTAVDVGRADWNWTFVVVVPQGVARADVAVVVGGEASAGTATVRFTTITRHGPIWHSAGGTKYHNDRDCRGLLKELWE